MNRRRLGLISIGLGLIACTIAVTASVAQAAPPEKVGWWHQLNGGPVALPVPLPTVPEGGIFVQQGATTDPVAFGALTYRVTDGSSSSLTLTAAPGSVALAASMQACKTNRAWAATTGPGPWAERPSFSNPCAPGIAAADGSAVAFNLNASFVANGVLDVAIVPLSAATPFAVAFEPPAADALASVGGRPTTSPPLPPPPAPAAGSGAGVSSAPAARPTGGPSGFTAPTPAAPPAPAPAATTDVRSAVADNLLNVAGFGDPDRGERALALGGASLIVVGWWLLSTRMVPMPRLLVGMGGATPETVTPPREKTRVGGVGRFAKPRGADPNLLR